MDYLQLANRLLDGALDLSDIYYSGDNNAVIEKLKARGKDATLIESKKTDTQVWVVRDSDGTKIEVPGTISFRDWITDLEYDLVDWRGIKAHRGYAIAVDSVVDAVLNGLQNEKGAVSVMGHSLGGGIAPMLALALSQASIEIKEVFAYEPPRWTDQNGLCIYTHELGSVTWRTQNDGDPVPHLPFYDWGYCQVGDEIYFATDGQVHINRTNALKIPSSQLGQMLQTNQQASTACQLSICPPSHQIETIVAKLKNWINTLE